MLEREKIVQRRKEIAEIRHADSVYRDIVAREKERAKYEKRWFWELLQNAIDSVGHGEKVKVKIEVSDNEISFSHTGNPFELDDILSLIIQGSSKNEEEGKVGRFGTGFMTTYLLSKEVTISGALTKNDGCFQFVLNRSADSKEQFYERQQESNDAFDNSVRENTYLGDTEFQTKFTYPLDSKGKQTAEIGLHGLDELIPITQLFNEKIESVIVKDNQKGKTFNKTLVTTHTEENYRIDEWNLNTIVNDEPDDQITAYIFRNEKSDVCILTQIENGVEKVYLLNNNHPRLYFTFPLVGTEEIGIPIIVNSSVFDPRIERDGIYLRKTEEDDNAENNQTVLRQSLIDSSLAFAKILSKKSVKGIYELFNYKAAKDLDWIDLSWFRRVKAEVLTDLSALEILATDNDKQLKLSFNTISIPYLPNKENIYELWNLLFFINGKSIPLKDELDNWVAVAENIAKIKFDNADVFNLKNVFGLKELLGFVEERGTSADLSKDLTDNIITWVNQFYSLVTKELGNFPLDRKIVLNQENIFRKGEGMYWDECKDDALVEISILLGKSFASKFISRQVTHFHIVGIEDYSKQHAVTELKSSINNLSEKSFSKTEFLKANAIFLKWLIIDKQIETIKDLKILTGAGSKADEQFIFDHFPKTDHLLLTPKPFFESEFPLYAAIIRDKDCLNPVYYEFLISEHFQFLSNNGFIHYSPLVIREEIADRATIEQLIVNEEDLTVLKDSEGQINQKIMLRYSDFAYLTSTTGHIYARNTTQRSSLERFKFLLLEAAERDPLFDYDVQEVKIEGQDKAVLFKQCLWVYRAKKLPWVYAKIEGESKFVNETPSSKNLSELIKMEELLVKSIRGVKQQQLLNKLNVGVSDLIRNTLPSEELKSNWDRAITNMITSDADPILVQEIFNDPNIRAEYEKRIKERKIINRNQKIGKLIEDLFKEVILKLKEKGYLLQIDRQPFGMDFILTDESSDLVNQNNQREGFKINDWFVELKATGNSYAAMTPLQAKTAMENKDVYALIVVPLDSTDPDLDYIRTNAKVISFIGKRIAIIFPEFNEVELKKLSLLSGKDGISVNIEDQNIRFRINSQVWNTENVESIETFIEKNFVSGVLSLNAKSASTASS